MCSSLEKRCVASSASLSCAHRKATLLHVSRVLSSFPPFSSVNHLPSHERALSL